MIWLSSPRRSVGRAMCERRNDATPAALSPPGAAPACARACDAQAPVTSRRVVRCSTRQRSARGIGGGKLPRRGTLRARSALLRQLPRPASGCAAARVLCCGVRLQRRPLARRGDMAKPHDAACCCAAAPRCCVAMGTELRAGCRAPAEQDRRLWFAKSSLLRSDDAWLAVRRSSASHPVCTCKHSVVLTCTPL